jgi:hypothetical protein
MKKNKKKWLLRAGCGAALAGAGLCCLIESGFYRHNGAETLNWVIAGTLSLVLTMAGLSLMIDSSRYK